jgi:serine/threonine protein kinase
MMNDVKALCDAPNVPGLINFYGAYHVPDSGQVGADLGDGGEAGCVLVKPAVCLATSANHRPTNSNHHPTAAQPPPNRQPPTAQISIVLEFMDGGSLADVLRIVGRIPEGVLSRICARVLQGLAFLHRRHLVHRDIKVGGWVVAVVPLTGDGRGVLPAVCSRPVNRPTDQLPPTNQPTNEPLPPPPQPANILINLQGEAKISDFGISAFVANTVANVRGGRLMGAWLVGFWWLAGRCCMVLSLALLHPSTLPPPVQHVHRHGHLHVPRADRGQALRLPRRHLEPRPRAGGGGHGALPL